MSDLDLDAIMASYLENRPRAHAWRVVDQIPVLVTEVRRLSAGYAAGRQDAERAVEDELRKVIAEDLTPDSNVRRVTLACAIDAIRGVGPAPATPDEGEIAELRARVEAMASGWNAMAAENELLRRPIADYTEDGEAKDPTAWVPVEDGRLRELEACERELAAAEAERDAYAAALREIIEAQPPFHDLTLNNEDCAACQVRREGGWPPSRLCNEHYLVQMNWENRNQRARNDHDLTLKAIARRALSVKAAR